MLARSIIARRDGVYRLTTEINAINLGHGRGQHFVDEQRATHEYRCGRERPKLSSNKTTSRPDTECEVSQRSDGYQLQGLFLHDRANRNDCAVLRLYTRPVLGSNRTPVDGYRILAHLQVRNVALQKRKQ